MNLPRGTQIIPHDISKRMADRSGASSIAVHVTASFDETGNLYVRNVAQQEAASAAGAVSRAVPAQIQQYSLNHRKR